MGGPTTTPLNIAGLTVDLAGDVTAGVASSADLAEVVTAGVASSANLAGDVTAGAASPADLAEVVTVGVMSSADLAGDVTAGAASPADLAEVVTVSVTSLADLAGDVTAGVAYSADLAGVVTAGEASSADLAVVATVGVASLTNMAELAPSIDGDVTAGVTSVEECGKCDVVQSDYVDNYDDYHYDGLYDDRPDYYDLDDCQSYDPEYDVPVDPRPSLLCAREIPAADCQSAPLLHAADCSPADVAPVAYPDLADHTLAHFVTSMEEYKAREAVLSDCVGDGDDYHYGSHYDDCTG